MARAGLIEPFGASAATIGLMISMFSAPAIVAVIITSIGDSYDGQRDATGQSHRFTGSGLAQMTAPLVAGVFVLGAW